MTEEVKNGTGKGRDYTIIHSLIGKLWLWMHGWKVADAPPPYKKYILIAEPHTSNWDLVYMLATMFKYRRKVSWIGKHTLFKKPFGPIMRWLGGIAINRSNPTGVVSQIAKKFKSSEELIIAISPSGTRKAVKMWKSGFYRMAHAAQVPITCGYLDYSRKVAGLGLSFVPSGDIKLDMDRIRAFYRDIKGKNSEYESVIRLREEDKASINV